jgi:hypothetical protein
VAAAAVLQEDSAEVAPRAGEVVFLRAGVAVRLARWGAVVRRNISAVARRFERTVGVSLRWTVVRIARMSIVRGGVLALGTRGPGTSYSCHAAGAAVIVRALPPGPSTS